jgi:hypothetical protein
LHTITAQAVDSAGRIGYSPPINVTVNIPNLAGWRGEYYTGLNFNNLAMVRIDSTIGFDWGNGTPDATRIPVDGFSVRWKGKIKPRYSQAYTISSQTDDGVRVWFNGTLVIDHWVNQGTTTYTYTTPVLTADQSYDVVMEYYENGGAAVAKLLWQSTSQTQEIIPGSRVTVPIPDNNVPFVWLSTPLAGDSFLTGDTITLTANASDSDGIISRVEFWADGSKLGELTAAPYLWSWPGPRTAGAHTVWAVAYDNVNANTTSAQLTVQSQPLALTPSSMAPTTGPNGEPGVTYTLQTTIPAGRNYVIEWSSDLTNWNILQSGTSTGAPIEVIDATVGLPKRFYRLRITN